MGGIGDHERAGAGPRIVAGTRIEVAVATHREVEYAEAENGNDYPVGVMPASAVASPPSFGAIGLFGDPRMLVGDEPIDVDYWQ